MNNQQQNIKKNQQRKSRLLVYGSYTVLVILIITFIGVPIIGQRFGSTSFNVFGKYGFKEIKYAEDNLFGRNLQNIDYYYSQVSPDARGTAFYTRMIWRRAFDETVQVYALLDIAKKNRFQISDDKLRTLVRDLPQLQNDDDEFNRDLYNSLDDKVKTNLITETRERNTAKKVHDDILDEVFMSEQEQEFYYAINENKKAFKFVRFDKNNVSNKEVIREYGKSHVDLFKSISYKSITVETKEEAQTIKDQIIAKEKTFDESILEFSIDSAKENEIPGDRGTSYAYQIQNTDGEDILQALLALQTTEDVSDIVETLTGKVAFYQLVKEIETPDFETADETLISSVHDYMVSYEPGILEDEANKEAEQFIKGAKAQGFSETASTEKLDVGSIPLAPLNINNVSLLDEIKNEGEPGIGSLVSTEDVLAEIYQLNNLNDISAPFILDDYIYVFQLVDIQTADSVPNELPEEFEDKISQFVTSANQEILKEAVVDENKFTDNFNEAYALIYQ